MSCDLHVLSKMNKNNDFQLKLPDSTDGTVYFASWNSLFFIDSVIFRRSALSGLYATSTRIIRVLFWKKIMCCLRPKIKIMKLPWNQTFPNRVKICQNFDFPGRNKQFSCWFMNVPDRPGDRGSTGVLWLGANWIPINCSIFWKNGTVSLANSHIFVDHRVWSFKRCVKMR